jgi:DNA-directed RNA polymerase specialized sigma subunit
MNENPVPTSDPFETYVKKPTPKGLQDVVKFHDPVIKSAVYRILGKEPSPVVYDRAKILAAQAVRSYNPSMGVPLKHWIQQGLRPIDRVSRDVHEPISIPEQLRRESAALHQARVELIERLGREPSQDELADHTGINPRKQRRISRAAMPIAEGHYMDLRGEDDDLDFDPETAPKDDIDELVSYVYHDLDPVDQQIYASRTGYLGAQVRSIAELARALNISSAAVSQRATRIQNRLEKEIASAGAT